MKFKFISEKLYGRTDKSDWVEATLPQSVNFTAFEYVLLSFSFHCIIACNLRAGLFLLYFMTFSALSHIRAETRVR